MVSTEYLVAPAKAVQLHRMASLGVEIVVNEHVKPAGAEVSAGSGPAEAAPTTSANATKATAAVIILRIESTPLVVNVARYERRRELGGSQVLRGEQPPFGAFRHRGALGVPQKLAVLSFDKRRSAKRFAFGNLLGARTRSGTTRHPHDTLCRGVSLGRTASAPARPRRGTRTASRPSLRRAPWWTAKGPGSSAPFGSG